MGWQKGWVSTGTGPEWKLWGLLWPQRDGVVDRCVALAREHGDDGLTMALPAIEWMCWDTVGC